MSESGTPHLAVNAASGDKIEGSGTDIGPARPSGNNPTNLLQSPTKEGDHGNEDIEALGRATSGRPLYTVFTKRQKQYIIFMASFGGFFSPLSANIYFPALNSLASDLKVSDELINLTLTSYMIFQGLAPTIMGDLADMTGRRLTYIICFTIYIGANIGLALQSSYAALFVLRCVQSTGSSGTIALAYGVVADVASSSERGKDLLSMKDFHLTLII